jgi:hypothetical protein
MEVEIRESTFVTRKRKWEIELGSGRVKRRWEVEVASGLWMEKKMEGRIICRKRKWERTRGKLKWKKTAEV